jgi:hypothetical protein
MRSTEPRAWWQRVIAGEPLPKGPLVAKSKCDGTIEDHRPIALDARELIRKHVFDQPVGSVFRLSIAYPWLCVMRLGSSTLELDLVTGRTVVVPLVWASCGVMGERMRLQCPLCARRVCTLYHLYGRVACRHCNGLWYAAQQTSSTASKVSDEAKNPPKARRLWATLGRQVPTEAPWHVAADVCAALRGAGTDPTQVGLLI